MQASEWGPPMWDSLHTISFNSPETMTEPRDTALKQTYIDYFKNVGMVLPCKYCRQSYQIFAHYIPIRGYLNSRDDFTYYVYWIHMLVNLKLNRFDNNISYWEVVQRYESKRVIAEQQKPDKAEVIATEMRIFPCLHAQTEKLLNALTSHNWDFEKLFITLEL